MAQLKPGLALVLGSLCANADEPPALTTIVISATRSEQPVIQTPASVSVVGRREIELSGAANLPELLRSRAGLHITDLYGDGSNATIDLRGFGQAAQSNTLVMIDGRRLNNSADTGNLNFNSIDLADVERVEVVQGSAGALFGNQAVGGVVNIITRRPSSFAAEFTAGAGSYNGYRLRTQVADHLVNGFSYLISGSKRESDNYRDHNDTSRQDLLLNLSYQHESGSVFGEFARDTDYLLTPGALFQDELDADRRQSVAAYRNDFIDSDSQVGRLGLTQSLTDHWRFQGELAYRDEKRQFITSARTFSGSLSHQDRRSTEITPRLIGQFGTARGTLDITLGVDWETTDYDLLTAFGPQGIEQSLLSYYGQIVLPLAAGWSATAGARHARAESVIADLSTGADLNDQLTVGSLGLVYRPDNVWRLFARADQNYRFPKVDEHTNTLFGQPIGLNTQTGVSYEIGAEMRRQDFRAKTVLYRLDLENEISFDASTWYNINLEQTSRRGMILETEWSASTGGLLGVNYSYTDSEISDGPFQGKRIPQVPEHNARIYGDYVSGPMELYAEAVLVGSQVLGSDFDNRFAKLEAFAVFNLRAGFHRGAWQFAVRANNLFDEKYSEYGVVGFDGFSTQPAFFPSPERNFWLTASLQIDRP